MSKLNNLKSFLFCIIAIISINVFAFDAGQILTDDVDEYDFEDSLEKYEVDNTFINTTSTDADYSKYKENSSHLSGSSNDTITNSKSKLKTSGISVLGAVDVPVEYLEFTNEDLTNKYRNKGKTNYGFSYFIDTYDYIDNKNTFSRTFDTSSEGKKGGSFILSGERYYSRGAVNFLWGINLGAGFNSGKGIFTNSTEQSKVNFILWTLPVDFNLGFEIPMGSWLKFAASGGPSVLGLWQTRSDREQEDSEKVKRQIGYGYSATGKLKFNFSAIYPELGVDMTSTYDVSDFYMNLEARVQQYDNFGDDIQISGTSFGLGFTFEFL